MTPATSTRASRSFFYGLETLSRSKPEFFRARRSPMTSVWALAALWLALALFASLLSFWLKIATALSEIVVGTIAQLIVGAAVGGAVLGADESWVRFLSGRRRDRADLPGRRGAGSARLSSEVAGGERRRRGELFLPLSWMRCGRALSNRLGGFAELACRSRDVHHFRRCGLCGDAGVRLQRNGLW